MARSRSGILALALCCAACLLFSSSAFVATPVGKNGLEVDARVHAATFAGLLPLAVEQPASAYDSVVAMLQSWLVGGTFLVLLYGAAFVAALANPLTKRRQEVKAEVDAMKKA